MSEKPGALQDIFLNACRKEKQQVTLYLSNGVKLQGIVSGFDSFCVLLRRGPQTQLVYKHSIATIVPLNPVSVYERDNNADKATDTSDADDAAEAPAISDDGSFQIA